MEGKLLLTLSQTLAYTRGLVHLSSAAQSHSQHCNKRHMLYNSGKFSVLSVVLWYCLCSPVKSRSALCRALQIRGIRCCWLKVYNLKERCILVAHTWLNFESHIPCAWSKGPVIHSSVPPSPVGMGKGNQRNIKRDGRTIKPCWCCSLLYRHSRSLAFKGADVQERRDIWQGRSSILQQALLSVEGKVKTWPPWFPFQVCS